MKNNYTLELSDGNELPITAYGNPKSNKYIIYVHGFKGFKDWGFVPYAAEHLVKQNFFVITFNFSHNGVEGNSLEFTILDKFAENTFSREVWELKELIAAVRNGFFRGSKKFKLGLLGHSRGGAIALLSASNNGNVEAVVTWSAISKLDRYSERQKAEWKERGYWEVENTRTKQIMRLNVSLLEDIEKNKSTSLNIENAIKNLHKPLLIAHGGQDLTVKITEGKHIYSLANHDISKFIEIENVGHTFNCKHPFLESNPKFDYLLEQTFEFYNKFLV